MSSERPGSQKTRGGSIHVSSHVTARFSCKNNKSCLCVCFPFQGEDGYIRLKRTDPSTLVHPEDDCGIDWTPADGVACTKDDGGHNVIPPAVPVCGTSGILFNSVVPYGGFLL